MKAIILAAGEGKRLDPIRGDKPKCLVEVGGVSLIERQIELLKSVGVDDITAVVGYRADRVRAHCGSEIKYVENVRHAETNSLYSLWLTRHLLRDGFIALNADVLFYNQILVDLISAPYEDALLVSYDPITQLADEEMKVKVQKGLIVDISKKMDPVESDGENVGIVKFGRSGARQLTEHIDQFVAEGNLQAWTAAAFRKFAALRPLHAISTRGYPWIEIDFPEDYTRAVEQVFPAIKLLEEFSMDPLNVEAMTIQAGYVV